MMKTYTITFDNGNSIDLVFPISTPIAQIEEQISNELSLGYYGMVTSFEIQGVDS